MVRGLRAWLAVGLILSVTMVGAAVVTAAPGDLDPSFDGDGAAVTDFGAADDGQAVVVQTDGKIVVVGGSGGSFAVARYNPDGSLDTGFDGDGRLTTDFGGDDKAGAVALQADGKIVAAGTTSDLLDFSKVSFAVARYNPDGSLDTGFDGDGKLTTSFGAPARAHGVAVQSEGMIVVVGDAGSGNAMDLALARYRPDGSLDSGFGVDGKVVTDLGGNDHGNAIALYGPYEQPVVAGWTTLAGGADLAVVRYGPDGSLDASFDGDGVAVTNLGGAENGNAVLLQPDGRIVVAGSSTGAGTSQLALARYRTDGALDTDLAGVGWRVFGTPREDFGQAVGRHADGRLVVGGRIGPANGSDLLVVQLTYDGRNDDAFGTDGVAITDLGGNDFGYGLALQADGKIVLAGETNARGTRDFAVARYLTAPADTTTPSSTGTTTVPATATTGATATHTATATGSVPTPVTATATGSTPTPATATVPSTATSTGTTTAPGCAPAADVGLVVQAANAADRDLLSATLAAHAQAWQSSSGRSLVYEIYLRNGTRTYREWLRDKLNNGFAAPGFCAANYVAVVSQNDLATFRDGFTNLSPYLASGTTAPSDYLDYAWRLVQMPSDETTAPRALPWLRDGCSESYGNLAIAQRWSADTGLAYGLLDFLVQEPQQRLNYDARAANGARLAFPALKVPYAGGWSMGGQVACTTVPPAEIPDPWQVNEAVEVARLNALELAPTMIRLNSQRYSGEPDTEDVVYVTGRPAGSGVAQAGGHGVAQAGDSQAWVDIAATKLRVGQPMGTSEIEGYLGQEQGIAVGQIAFYHPGTTLMTPTPVPTTPPWPNRMFLPWMSGPGGGQPWQYAGYAVAWRNEAGSPRMWLVRDDRWLSAGEVSALLGTDVEYEPVTVGEPTIASECWWEQGSRKICWSVDGLRGCIKVK